MANNLKSGDLRHPVQLLKKASYWTDEKGRRKANWETVCTAYAAISDVSGREFYEALAYHAEDVVTFTLRYREGVTPEWRVKYNGQAYEILEVNHLGYKYDYMRLKCRVIRGEGER